MLERHPSSHRADRQDGRFRIPKWITRVPSFLLPHLAYLFVHLHLRNPLLEAIVCDFKQTAESLTGEKP